MTTTTTTMMVAMVMVMMSWYHFVAQYHRYCIVSSYHCKHHVLASYHFIASYFPRENVHF